MQKSEHLEPLDPPKLADWYDIAIRALISADAEALESLLGTTEVASRLRSTFSPAQAWSNCTSKREVLRQLLVKTRSNLSLLQRVAVWPEPAEYGDVCRKWASGASVVGEDPTGVGREHSWPR